MPEGLLDTNLFIHAQVNDVHSEECKRFLAAVERGEIHARLEPVVLHELSYLLPRLFKQMDRPQVVRYLAMIVNWDGVVGNKQVFLSTLDRWLNTPGLSFVDAHLCAAAELEQSLVYTKNVRHFAGQGVDVPDPLPGTGGH